MRRCLRQAGLVFVTVLFGTYLVGADDPESSKRADEQLAAMTKRARLLRAVFDDADAQPPVLHPEPLLRYGDPTRPLEVDATVWLWVERKRPVAIASIFIRRDSKWNYELTSLTDRSLQMTGRPWWRWRPTEQQRKWIALDDEVPDKPVSRGRKLRALARQFEATETWEGETHQLRLLPRPLYRYSDKPSGVIDGALFAVSLGTNPEVLLQFEARRDQAGAARWFVSFARLAAAKLTVRHSGEVVWTADLVEPREYNPRKPYYAAWGPDRIVE